MTSQWRLAISTLITALFIGGSAMAQSAAPQAVKNVVHVVAVHLAFTNTADDVSATKRAIDAQDGPVLLVGHSYGGVVITEAGNDPKVAGLVYVDAFAPNDGEAIGDLGKEFPKLAGLDELRPAGEGYLILTPKGYMEDFAQDLSEEEKQLLVATQPPAPASIFGAKVSKAAWHTKPTWYVVGANDRMIAPEHQKSMAKQLDAATTVVPASHVSMLSHPQEVAGVIEQAAAGKAR